MDLQQVITFINQCGFPIFVAAVLLWRVDRMHAENNRALHLLTLAVNDLKAAILSSRKVVR
jgi:hypothetical protein